MATVFFRCANNWELVFDVYESSVNVTNNTSVVTISNCQIYSGTYSNDTIRPEGVIYVNGQSVVSFSRGNYNYTEYQKRTSFNGSPSGSITITHNDNGSGTATFSSSIYMNSDNGHGWSTDGISPTDGNGNYYSMTLTAIQRGAAITSSANPTLGSGSTTFTIDPANDSLSLSYTATYSIGSQSGTIFSDQTHTGNWTYTWTPPNSIASAISGTSGTVTVTLTTYYNSTNIGSNTCSVTVTVPNTDTFAPKASSLTVTASSSNSTVNGWGVFVQGYSKLTAKLVASDPYGSSLSYTIDYGISTFTGSGSSSISASHTTDSVLNTSGSYTPKVTVKNARGFSREYKFTQYTVYPYASPKVTNVSIYRANSSGSPATNGTYIKVSGTRAYSTCGGKNSCSMKFEYKLRTASSYTTGISATTAETISGNVNAGLSSTLSYDARIAISDSLTTAYSSVVIPTQNATFNLGPKGVTAAFGMYADTTRPYSVELQDDWGLYVKNSSKILFKDDDSGSTLSSAQTIKSYFCNLIYPVGSIYLSLSSSFNPATAFGGTWKKMTDRFLVGAGSSYSLGATGGSNSDTTINTSHTHGTSGLSANIGILNDGYNTIAAKTRTDRTFESNIYARGTQAGEYAGNFYPVSIAGSTDSAGSSTTVHGMPAYTAVYMWKRTK